MPRDHEVTVDTFTPPMPSPVSLKIAGGKPALSSSTEEARSPGGGLLLVPHPCVGVLGQACCSAPGIRRGARVLVLPQA